MRARHSTLEQFIANEVEYESSSERMVIRQRIHPTAAQVLREFAAQVIEHDVVAHKKTPRGEPWGEVFCRRAQSAPHEQILAEASRRADADSRWAAALRRSI